MAFTLVFTSLNVASCAHKDVRVVKTGDVIYFDTKNLNWDTVKIYFYSTWGKSEIVKWDVDLGQVFRHIFLRIYIFLFKLRLGVVINIKENL